MLRSVDPAWGQKWNIPQIILSIFTTLELQKTWIILPLRKRVGGECFGLTKRQVRTFAWRPFVKIWVSYLKTTTYLDYNLWTNHEIRMNARPSKPDFNNNNNRVHIAINSINISNTLLFIFSFLNNSRQRIWQYKNAVYTTLY